MNNFETALTKELCPICCAEMVGCIVMNTRLTRGDAKKVKDLHGKVVGFSNKVCTTCEEHSKIALGIVIIDEEQSDKKSLEGIYRTGQIMFIKNESEFVKDLDPKFLINLENAKMLFVDEKAAKQIGLIE